MKLVSPRASKSKTFQSIKQVAQLKAQFCKTYGQRLIEIGARILSATAQTGERLQHLSTTMTPTKVNYWRIF
jgi:hypothetical protein